MPCDVHHEQWIKNKTLAEMKLKVDQFLNGDEEDLGD
jgi:hypothetical protein